MMDNREEFLKRILATFKIEAAESVQKITSNLIGLEKTLPESDKMRLIESVYREAHSLKGASRSVNNSEIESICQSLESIFSALKNKEMNLSQELFDLFHVAVNLINEILSPAQKGSKKDIEIRISDLLKKLLRAKNGKIIGTGVKTSENIKKKRTKKITPEHKDESNQESVHHPSTTEPVKTVEETIRVSIGKLDSLLLQVEEMLSLKLVSAQLSDDIKLILQKLNNLNRNFMEINPKARNLIYNLQKKQVEKDLNNDELNAIEIIRFFEEISMLIKNTEEELDKLRKSSIQNTYEIGLKFENLMDDVKSILAVPFSTIIDVFPKAARDLSVDKGKKTELIIQGEELEIDRRILEEIHMPLMHLLRNCIDHGIEKPEDRKLKNKPEQGTIRFKIDKLENNKIEITVSDDGAGIDTEELKRRYQKQEGISQEEADKISEDTLLHSIFKSGFSTSKLITDISGRGLGLAIVHEKIDQLGGSVSVNTMKDKGTEFRIQIPLSLITFRGIVIRIGDQRFLISTVNIKKVLQINRKEIKTIRNKTTISVDGKVIPLVYLSDILEIPFRSDESENIPVLIIGDSDKQVGFAVDEILEESFIQLKKFNKQLRRVRNISGATVTGSGKIIPVLNVSDLLKSATLGAKPHHEEKPSEKQKEKHSVLVVEDSITSRMLIKNILETAGYSVTTAIDGIDGLTKLKEEKMDLVVSDIDMPRMNGFELTSRIRSDKVLSEIPVVLVTSLSKREDKERGMEAGANAYIIKSSFDQNNLLEVVDKLV